MRCLYTSYARPMPAPASPRLAPRCRPSRPGTVTNAGSGPEPCRFSALRIPRTRRDWATPPPLHALDMNRRYAYRDYEILVSAQPAGGQPGWRPEICVIAPDDHWQFVPTHHSLVANDPGYCLE